MLTHTKKIISNVSLVLLYAVFFVVQIFFNAGSTNPASNYLSVVEQVQGAKGNSISQKEDSSSNSSKIRLNKRFHPQSMPSLEYTVGELPQTYINVIRIDKPQDYLLISSILADSLRGPPVVA